MCDKICPYRHIFLSEVNQTLVTRRCNDYNEPTSDKSPLLVSSPIQLTYPRDGDGGSGKASYINECNAMV